MNKILHIDAGPRGERSVSRRLGKEFIEEWQSKHSDDTVLYRDLGHNPVSLVTEGWVEGAYTLAENHSPQAQEAMKESDALVDELLAVDRYVFTIPMYNFNVPAGFKAYIDQIVRINRTFNKQYEGLVKGKKMLVITARGGNLYGPGQPWEAYDFQEPYLRVVFGFIGIQDIIFVHCDGTTESDDIRNASLKRAREELNQLVARW